MNAGGNAIKRKSKRKKKKKKRKPQCMPFKNEQKEKNEKREINKILGERKKKNFEIWRQRNTRTKQMEFQMQTKICRKN